jgi:hypothetical protein
LVARFAAGAARIALVRWFAARLVPGTLSRRPLKAAHDLAKGFKLALVDGFLALGLFENLENLIHLVHRFAQFRQHIHHVINRLANGFGVSRAQRMPLRSRSRGGRNLTFGSRIRRCFGRLDFVGWPVRRGRKKLFRFLFRFCLLAQVARGRLWADRLTRNFAGGFLSGIGWNQHFGGGCG